MRIFTVAQMDDNVEQIRKDLQTFLYHLRLPAEVYVVQLPDSAIRAYTYERALMMEQRAAMMKELRLKKRKHKKLTVPDQIVGGKSPTEVTPPGEDADKEKAADGWSAHLDSGESADEQITKEEVSRGADFNDELLRITPDKQNVRRMHTAVQLNEVIVERSHEARLVIINLPGVPKSTAGEENYMEYLEVLSEGLERVLMVRGSGKEVVTMYS